MSDEEVKTLLRELHKALGTVIAAGAVEAEAHELNQVAWWAACTTTLATLAGFAAVNAEEAGGAGGDLRATATRAFDAARAYRRQRGALQ